MIEKMTALFSSLVLFVSSLFNPSPAASTYLNVNPTQQTTESTSIGGQKDGHGCLTSAGYSWDNELKICVRSFELDETKRNAVRYALSDMQDINNLVLIEVTETSGICKNCGKVKFRKGDEIVVTDAPVPNKPMMAPPDSWLNYFNPDLGFQFSYPKKYKIVQDLYTYPNEVVILYDGSQSYNLVVEKWDWRREFDKKYKDWSGKYTVYVSSKGNIITMLNVMNEPDIAKVIESYQLIY